MPDSPTNQYPRFIFIVLVLVYVVTGKLGLMLALPPGYASAIFPPSGIALAASYLAGRAALPWIFQGSLLLNIWVGYTSYHHISETSLVTALSIAIASTLQAAVGGWALTRAIGAQSRFDQVSDVLRFLFIVPLTCLISATLSVGSLVIMHVVNINSFIKGWMAWWTGDTLGVLVLFPICLVFAAKPRDIWKKRQLLVALPMLLALVLAIISFITGSKWEENNSLMELRALSSQIKTQLITRLDEQYMLLEQTREFFLHEDKQISRDEFHRYTQKALEHFGSIQAIEWAPEISDSLRSTFEAKQRKELPNFEIQELDISGQLIPAQRRPNYYPVTYLEPITENQSALGLDLASSPDRRALLSKAISQNKLVATEPVRLIQDHTDQTGVLLIYPIIGDGDTSSVVLTVLKMDHFIEKLLPKKSSILFVRLVDTKTNKYLYNSFNSDSTEPLIKETINFGERQYRLEISPTPTYWIEHQGLQSYGILAVGLFGIGVLGSLLLLGTGYTTRVEIRVNQRTSELQESEKRFRTMADSAPVLIWLTDTDKQCFWVNKVWLKFTGREMKQEIGNGWAEGVHPDDRQHCLDIYNDHFNRRQPFTMEYRLKRYDGVYRWLTDNGIPRYDNEGQFEGYIGSCIDITEMRQAQEHLQISHDLLDKLSQHVPGAIYQFRRFPDGRASFPYASQGIQEIYEVTPTEVNKDATPALARLHPDDLDRMTASMQNSVQSLQLLNIEYRVNLPQKGVRWLYGQAKPEKMTDGSILWHGFITDITERKHVEARLQLAASVFTHAREGILIADADANIIEVNDAFTRITGYSREEVLGQNPRLLQSGRHQRDFYAEMWQALTDQGHWYGEIWNRRKNGEAYAELLTISTVRDTVGHVQNYVALFTDITPMKEYQQQLEHIAHYDVLTGLPNRVLLADRLQRAMIQSQRRDQSIAVVFLDLDGFKAVNDLYGHAVGDQLLICIGERMRTALREGDTLARIGGDEFVAVLVDLEPPHDYESVLKRLLQAASDPVQINKVSLHVSASIGVTIYPLDSADAEQLMRHADQAMYQAKQTGKNCYHLFDLDQDS